MPLYKLPDGFERIEIKPRQRDETVAKRVRPLAEGEEICVIDRLLGEGYYRGHIRNVSIDLRSYDFVFRDDEGKVQVRTLFYKNLVELAVKV